MPSSTQFPIFELSSQDFEFLCLDLLNAEGGAFILNTDEKQQWFDITGERPFPDGKSKRFAIEIRHRTTFNPEGFRLFIDRISNSNLRFDEYIFITSSPLTAAQIRAIQSKTGAASGLNVVLFGQKEVFDLLAKHPNIAARYFKVVKLKIAHRRISWTISLVFITVSVIFYIWATYPIIKDKEGGSFESQIFEVETNLESLRALERSLLVLKNELQSTSEESARIKKEYEEALKLRAITSEQLEQIKKAVSAQSIFDIFMNYFFGFLLGIASSILATIGTDWWKARRELSGP